MTFEENTQYKEGDKRTVTEFLWFPTMIGLKIRWLRKARIEQTLTVWKPTGADLFGGRSMGCISRPLPFNSDTKIYVWKNTDWKD